MNRRKFLTGVLATPVVMTGVKAGWIQSPPIRFLQPTLEWSYRPDRMVWTLCWFDSETGQTRFEEITRESVHDVVPFSRWRNTGMVSA